MAGRIFPVTHTGITADHERRLRRHTVPVGPIENVNTVSASGSAVTLPDVDTATMHHITLTANCTLTFPTPGAGKSFTLKLIQDATGSRTVTWPSSSVRRFPSGASPTLSTTSESIDVFAVVCDDDTKWDIYFAGKNMT